MGFFSKAKDNYDKRKDIADYNFRARTYVTEGQNMYKEAYVDLQVACAIVSGKVNEFIRYKRNVLDEINRTLKKIDGDNKEYQLSSRVDFISLDACAVGPVQQLDCIDKALATWILPSIGDLFRNVSLEEYYAAKENMYQAKVYKETMRAKKEELKNAKYAVKSIPDYMYKEQQQIDELMCKFRKTAELITGSTETDKTESLCQIAGIIAESLTTDFIDNNYQVTAQYNTIHERITQLNNSLSDAEWLIG